MSPKEQAVNDLHTAVVETLRAAGWAEADGLPGFFAMADGNGKVIVVADLGDHAEGHFASDGQCARRARMTEEYRQVLAAAGWAVEVRHSGAETGLVVAGRAKAAC